ncbi:RNA polymerase-binding transcription factor CarD [Clostridium puniceum]|uniref:RNA polymerase-binding transcription factor CarD n=1 Tax=Clostridium puniceum TaxID=29367 RepID=A0A1S8TWM1_9CLOT|nr:CarD family transcriptional regulator [Clostridium puniceum]OOM81992.1 RNA polymerase-binding transcription factor CarD [Clostridium puniceum]
MFNIGDKIVYPSQGIGVIDEIEEKEFKGERQMYYTIQLYNNTMKLTLPLSRIKTSNMRLVSDSKTLDNCLKHINKFVVETGELSKVNFKERKTANELKIKSGALDDYLQVICNLTQLKMEHNLNSSEKQMLTSAKKIVIEEISQSKNLSSDEATNLLDIYMAFSN